MLRVLAGQAPLAPTVPCQERGAILVVVMILAVTFSVLSMALLSTAEISLRIQGNSQDLERVERAAQSGVEWAAAAVKSGGFVDGTRSTTLDTGVVVSARVRTGTAPHLVGAADSDSLSISVGANAVLANSAPPHAFVSFADLSTLNHELTIAGSAHFGDTNTSLSIGASPLQMIGNLELVTTRPIGTGKVVHQRGATTQGVTAIGELSWNTTRYSNAGNWTVPVHVYNGTTTISGQDLVGIVVVNLSLSQKLTLQNTTIRGALVVPCLYPPLLELLGIPTIEIGDGVTIEGGTTETGNLAILAPGSKITGARNTARTVSGVVYAREIDSVRWLDFEGQLLLRKGISSMNSAMRIERPAGFVPNVPHGINWTGPQVLRMEWVGRQ